MQLDLVPIIKHIFQTYYGKPTNSITSNLQLNEDSKLDQVGQPNVQQVIGVGAGGAEGAKAPPGLTKRGRIEFSAPPLL